MKVKKAIIILIGFFLCSCAAAPKMKVVNRQENPYEYEMIAPIVTKMIIHMDFGHYASYRYLVVDSPELNAFANNDYVLFFTNMLIVSFSKDELHYIVAHEIAHIKLGHIAKQQAASIATYSAFQVLNIFVPGAGLLNLAVNPAVTGAFSRSQEMDADKEAVDAICQCGLGKHAAISALEKLAENAKAKGIDDSNRIGIWDTHPRIIERIDRIRGF